MKTEAFENGAEKKASFSVISISVFACFSADDRPKRVKKYACSNENKWVWTAENKWNASVVENILLRFSWDEMETFNKNTLVEA